MALKLEKKNLENVNGGAIGDIGWYYSVEYRNNDLGSNMFTDGPFESETLALSAGESKRLTLLESYSYVGPVSVRYNSTQFKRN